MEFTQIITNFAIKMCKRMKKERTFISFDWALKHLLHDKVNFDVLEGLARAKGLP